MLSRRCWMEESRYRVQWYVWFDFRFFHLEPKKFHLSIIALFPHQKSGNRFPFSIVQQQLRIFFLSEFCNSISCVCVMWFFFFSILNSIKKTCINEMMILKFQSHSYFVKNKTFNCDFDKKKAVVIFNGNSNNSDETTAFEV